ncbi:MAG: hypothetical protein OXI58_09630 [Gemmatimonadota bacterium]|nr:hypothetical protein [Gemmatimonadota bacterium]
MRSALEWTLAMALCVGHNFIGVRSYILLDRYSGYADHFNTVGVIFALFWVALTALLLALIRPFLRLPTSTFALIYAALMVATVMPTMGFGGYFIPLLAGVFYYATPENNWRELLWDHIPDWAAPRDLEMIRNLFEGAPEGAPLPWDAWLGPSIFWGLFMVAFFLVSFSLIALLHHQWASGERLVYPLAVVPTVMVESVENPAKSLFRNPLFWIGFFIAWIIPTVNMLDQVFDFETINNFGIPSTRIFLRRIGISYGINVNFLVVGLSYLLNLNVLLSVWLFHILIYLEHGLLGFFGVVVNLPAQPHQQVSVLMSHQQMGALIFLILSSLWMSRDFLKDQWRAIASGTRGPNTHLPSPRTLALMGVAGLVYMAYFLHATGLSLGWSLAFLLVSLLVFLGTARLLVQTGLGRLRAPHSIPPLFTNIFGTAYFGDKGLTAMGLNMVWAADVQLFFMGTMAHAFKVCEEVKEKISARKLLFFLASALVISAITTVVVYIWLGYQHGMMHGFRWYYINSPLSKWGWVAKTVNNPHPPQHLTTLFTGIGAGLAGLLSFAQHRLAGWPLHPVGLAVALTNTVRGDWFGIFLAWLVKSILISYGGVILYRKVRPLFLGFIMGACVGVGGSSLVYSFYYF